MLHASLSTGTDVSGIPRQSPQHAAAVRIYNEHNETVAEYRLVACVAHVGGDSLEDGHYLCLARRSPDNQAFRYFNDNLPHCDEVCDTNTSATKLGVLFLYQRVHFTSKTPARCSDEFLATTARHLLKIRGEIDVGSPAACPAPAELC